MDFIVKDLDSNYRLDAFRNKAEKIIVENEFRWIQIGTKYRISKKSFDGWLDKM